MKIVITRTRVQKKTDTKDPNKEHMEFDREIRSIVLTSPTT